MSLFKNSEGVEVAPANPIFLWRRPESLPEVAENSLKALAEALSRAGFNPRDFSVSYWEARGEWIGGAKVFPMLTVRAPNGRAVDMDAELVARVPRDGVETIRFILSSPSEEAAS